MRRANVCIQLLIICVYLIARLVFYYQTSQNTDFIEFIDVGQGDATLIHLGTTKILIDGGPDYGILYRLQKYALFTKCHIDILVLTHPHADHIVGLNRILEFCSVDKVVYPYFEAKTEYDTHFLTLINTKAKIIPDLATSLSIGKAHMYFLWPPKGYIAKNVNNQSVVILFKKDDFEALLMGDAELEAQKAIPFSDYLPRVDGRLDVLKVAHHGSITGLNEQLFTFFTIHTAVISVGAKNSYNLPSQKVVDALIEHNLNSYRTDKLGSIVIRIDKL